MLARLTRHISSSTSSTSAPLPRPATGLLPFFTHSIRPAPIRQTTLRQVLARAYSGGSNPWTSNASVRSSVWIIIGLNTAVFGAWQYAKSYKDRKLLQQLHENFTLSEHNLTKGRYWTLLTSAFSHMNAPHFIFNMFAIHAFGTIMAMVPGVAAVHVWTLALGSGIAGSIGWVWHRQQSRERRNNRAQFTPFGLIGEHVRTIHSALGASGVAMGMGATAALLWPTAPMNFMFIPISVPLWLITAGYFAIDAYYLDSEKTGIGHSAHLAGALYGAVYYLAYLRRFGGVWHLLRSRR